MHMNQHGSHHRGRGHHGCCGGWRQSENRTGNTAFDEYRATKIAELDAEFRAFQEFRAEQRRKRDDEAFQAFKAARKDEPKASAG